MRTRTKIAIGTAVGTLLAIAAVAPFTLMLIPNPVPVRVRDVSSQPPGTYIGTRSGTYHVFPRAEQVEEFPKDALVADKDVIVWVRYKQLDRLSAYGIRTFPEGEAVAVTKDAARPRLLEIRPKGPLEPGRYYAEVSREGLFGGTDFVYFRVTAWPTSVAGHRTSAGLALSR